MSPRSLRTSLVVFVLLAACSSETKISPDASAASPDGGAVTGELLVVVRGTPAGDEAQTRSIHDQAASASRLQAVPAGDIAHYVYLRNTGEFLGVDRWTNLEGLAKVLADPGTKQAFAAAFAPAPEVTKWKPRAGWTTFGSVADLGGASRAVLVSVRGRIAGGEANARTIHNQVVAAAPPHETIGDTSHLVFVNIDDPNALLVFEVWSDAASQGQFYSDPKFGEAVAKIFEGPPTITIFKPTSWYQWQPSSAANTCDGKAICWGPGGCMDCAIAGPCRSEAAACQANAECMALSSCGQQCRDDACRAACAKSHPDGVTAFNALTVCVVCRQCPVDCGSPSFKCQ